jgi:hypothetical protein
MVELLIALLGFLVAAGAGAVYLLWHRKKLFEDNLRTRFPLHLQQMLREEWPEFADQITTGKCYSILLNLVDDNPSWKRHYFDRVRIRDDDARRQLAQYQIDRLAPEISPDFQMMEKDNPADFFKRFDRCLSLSL